MLKVAFAGTPDFAVPTLRSIAASHHRLVGILTQPDRPAGRGRELKASPVKQLALQLGLPLAQPVSLKSEPERASLHAWAPDVLVVVAYGLILPTAALTIPRLGGINVHASLLPRWRGAAPVQRAILAGDAQTGITIMQMAAGLDTGPILMQRSVELTGEETSRSLLDQLANLGAGMLTQTLDEAESGSLRPQDQPAQGATYAAKIEKSEALIDWQRSARSIANQVRAFNPWPVAQTLWEGQQLRVWEASAISMASVTSGISGISGISAAGVAAGQILSLDSAGLLVRCGDNNGVLRLSLLQLAGRRVVPAREFAGGRQLTGMRFG
jgi:methionyl-tRNA formyltransferase